MVSGQIRQGTEQVPGVHVNDARKQFVRTPRTELLPKNKLRRANESRRQKESMNFSQLGLAPAQVRACESLGYNTPTPIQRQAIPIVLNGQDLIGCAETGTGKTAAFLLPIIQKISERPLPGIRVLVLAPTRELALQIQKSYGEFNRVKTNRSVIAIGGANMRTQIADLRRGAAVVIATPGRVLDLIERGVINLSGIEIFVLDEADRMLDMGFLPAIRRVLSRLPTKRQTLLFSATMPSEIENAVPFDKDQQQRDYDPLWVARFMQVLRQVYRIFCDSERRQWFVDGVYD